MANVRRTLYPTIEPFRSGFLEGDPLHRIYFEECGNPRGKPVVFLHGGPGGGISNELRRFWDPEAYRIVLFDQRGCGKSTPYASLQANTTWHLVDDIERLRSHLGIERWQVFGGSWGSTLALAYAERHPERVVELILRGIFLLRTLELQWFYQEGASRIFSDAWEHFIEPIPQAERGNLIEAYHRRLSSPEPSIVETAAVAWSRWEAATSRLLPSETTLQSMQEPKFAVAFARIENHYMVNRGFFTSDAQLLEDVAKIRHIPAVIVQGRYDVVCPMQSAWDLHRAWPEADFHIVPDAGHSAFESGILHALVEATDRFR